MARARSPISIAVCLGALAAAGLATAAPASAFKSETTTISLDGTHNYNVQFRGSSLLFKRSGSQPVTVVAQKHHASASYEVQGTSTDNALQGDFGPFGKVDVKLHPRKTTHPDPPHNCTGTIKKISGLWKGTLKFKGESGYTKVSAKSAKGYRLISNLECNGGGGAPTTVTLHASQPSPPYPSFTASVRKKTGANPSFYGSTSNVQGDVSIFRAAAVKGKPSQFTYDDPAYTHAVVDPPSPFSGTGTFDDPGSWTGDLKVKLPGAGKVPLTGAGFIASLGESAIAKLQ